MSTGLDFRPAVVTEEDLTPPVDTSVVTEDVYPDTSSDPEAPYGRFRNGKPRKNPPRTRGRATGAPGTSSVSAGAKNASKARAAAEVLGQAHDLLAAGLFVVGMQRTASVVAKANDPFKERAAAALVTDPKLCDSILRGGSGGAKLSLIIGYIMFGAAIAPTAIEEYRETRLETGA